MKKEEESSFESEASMGRGTGEAFTKVGVDAQTFYDTQAFQYGVRDKWGYAFYQPSTDNEHPIFPHKPDTGLFIKPWEFGGHPHNFYKATRAARSNDPYVHYERGKALERHERLVAEVDAWRRQEFLKEEMLIQMSKLQAVERQRRHFQELKRQMQLEQLQWSRPSTAILPSQNQMSKCKSNNGSLRRTNSVDLSAQPSSLRGGSSWQCNRISKSAPISARCSVVSREELAELAMFERKNGL